MKPYKTVRTAAADTVIIHKSRFIGYASPAATEEEALAFLQPFAKSTRMQRTIATPTSSG